MVNEYSRAFGRTPEQDLPRGCRDIYREFRQVPAPVVQNRPIGLSPVASWFGQGA